MGMHKTCVRYKTVGTKRGVREMRCASYSNKKGKAMCHAKLKGGPRSPGLIHAAECRRRKHK